MGDDAWPASYPVTDNSSPTGVISAPLSLAPHGGDAFGLADWYGHLAPNKPEPFIYQIAGTKPIGEPTVKGKGETYAVEEKVEPLEGFPGVKEADASGQKDADASGQKDA